MRSLLVVVMAALMCLLPVLAAGQAHARAPGQDSHSSRANRALARALQAYHAGDPDRALEDAGRAIRLDGNFFAAHLLKAEVLFHAGKYAGSAASYKDALDIDRQTYPQAWYFMGLSLLRAGAYEAAADALEAFLAFGLQESTLKDAAVLHLQSARFAAWAVAHPVEFTPVNLGPEVNTAAAEYSPALTADSQTLIFTRRSQRSGQVNPALGSETEDFYVSSFVQHAWTRAVNLGPPINTDLNEGAQHISIDGRELYFTACNRPDGYGSCDLYYARRTGDSWGKPVNLGSTVNSPAWDSQPSLSADGNSLYFASARRGGYGDMDLWMSTRDSLGNWGPPQNLGPVINTAGREMTPFIHPDNKTLYFASDGHPGLGGFDLFYSRQDQQGKWTTPVNLGYPINTLSDESGMIVDAAGYRAFYAADRPGGFGGLDIYSFALHEEARPEPLTYMKGMVYDADTQEPLEAMFELADLQTGKIHHEAASDPVSGDFLIVVPARVLLGLSVSKPGYIFYSRSFLFEDYRDVKDPYTEDIALFPVKAGVSSVLQNVFFDTGSHSLKPESEPELNRLVKLLEENPGFRIELAGHTDNVGTFEYNKRLSENRAVAVARYLVEQGIDASRIITAGYADTQPVDTNDTEQGRAGNRRTTFSILAW